MTPFVQDLIRLCAAERDRFGNGAVKEDDEAVRGRVAEYWAVVSDKPRGDLPWSAAFISHVMRAAGAGDRFRPSMAHCHYIEQARAAALRDDRTVAYHAFDPARVAPRIGDLVCNGREAASLLDWSGAERQYRQAGFYPSHADVVIAINDDRLVTIGGNVNNSVMEKRLAVDAEGRLRPRVVDGRPLPWIAVLRCMI